MGSWGPQTGADNMAIIGIGALDNYNVVIERSEKAISSDISVIVFAHTGSPTPSISGIDYHLTDNPEKEMIDTLIQGKIDGAVRGTLPSHSTLRYLKQRTGVDYLERIAFLETYNGEKFLLAPVGIDEGSTINDKVRLIRSAERLADLIHIPRSVAILSGGRLDDVGRDPGIDRSLADAELLARITGGFHAEILIEDAIGRYGIIIAPDGVSGNLIFRTLVLLGSGTSHGAPVINIDVTFVDTSRASRYYDNAIRLAAALGKSK